MGTREILMTDNASEIDITARSTIGTSTATNQISSRAKKLGQLVEKGLSGLGENQIKGFLNNALLEIEGSLSDFEKDYDGELLRLERLLSSRKGKVTKALSAGLVKVQYGKGQDYYAVDYAQMYNAFFEKVLKIVKATKSQGSSAILGQIQEHIHEMIGNDSLTDDDKALMNKLIQEMQALQKERAKIKVVEVGKPPEQKVTVEVKQEVKPVTQEEVVAAVKEKQAAGIPAVESQSLHTATIKKLEADVARLQKEMEEADKKAAALFDAMDAGDSTVSQSVADAAEEDYQKKTFLWKKAQQDLENEKAALKREGIGGKQQLTAEEVAEFRKKQKDATAEATTTPRSKPDKRPSKQPRSGGGKQAPSEDDADYVKSARERIKVLDDAYDQFLGMQSMWMSGIEQSITDMLDGVRLASQEMVFVITAEIQKNIGGKLKTIGKQIEESFGAKSTSGVASIAGKLDTINTTLLEIKNGLIRQKYMQDVRSVPKSIEDEAPQKAIAEMIGNALNQELAPLLGEVLGETSEYNWQKWLTLEGDVRKPFIDKFIGLNKGGIVPGTGTSDSVPALLTPGEWVINPRKLAGGTFEFAYEADAALKAASLGKKYKTESTYLNSLVADRSVSLAKDLLLQPMDKVIAYDTVSNIAGAIGSFNRPTLTDSVLPIRGADRGAGWNMYVGELAALERGKGLGPTLIGMALAKALKGPVGDLLTHIELKAIPFKDTIASYLKMGFVPVGEQHPGEPLIPMAANIRDFLSSPKVSPDVRLALPKKGATLREHPALKDFSLTAFPYEVIDPVTAAGTVVPAGTRTQNIFKYLASGGPLMPGQTAVVGEEGPEMLVPAGSGFHVLNNKIFRAIGGMRFLKKGTVKADQEPDLDWQGMKWSPDYVTGMSEGLAFVTGNALKEAIRADVGPEFRTAAGGFTKSLNASLVDIVTGRSINAPVTPIDPVKQMKLDTGKLGMQFERLISSTRYAVTGGLIFAHVLRMLTATSQVYQKSMGAVGRGWGYMLDMVVRPLLPAFLLITRGFIWLGNFFKGHKLIALGTGLALVGVAVFAALYSIYKMKKDVEAAAAAFEKLTAALNGTPYTPPEQGPGILSRIWGGTKAAGGKVRDWVNTPVKITLPRMFRKKAQSGYRIPGYGGGDSVGILAEPGELVVPKEVVRGFEHRAAGGVAGSGGDFGSWIGGVIGGAGDIFKGGITTIAQGVGAFLSSDIGKSIVGGLGVASKMIGAVMAPIAGVGIAIGAIKGGMHGLGRIFVKGQQAQVETSIAVGKAQRNLLSMISLEGMGILAVVVGIAAILDKYLKGEEIPTIGFAGGLNIWDLITGAAKSIWDFIKTPPKSVWEFLKGVAKSVWEFIKGGLKSLWDFVKPVLKSVWEFVKPVFKSVWEFVKGGLKSIWEFVKPVLKPIWDYVKAGVKDVWDFIKTPVKSIWDFITEGKTNEPKPTPEGTGWKSAGIKGGVITSALVAIDEVINKKRPLGEALPDIATGGLIGVAAGAITAATGGLTGGPLAALGHDWSIGFGSRTGGTIADALGLDKEGKKIAEDIGGMGMSVVNDSLGWAATGAMVGGVVAGPPGAAVGAGAGAIAGPVIGMFQDLFKIKEEVDKLTSGVNLTPEQANAGGHLTNQYGLIGSAVATAYNVGVDMQGLPAAAAGAVTGGIDAGAKAVESALKTAGELLTTAVDTVKGVVDGVLNTVKEWQDAAAQAGAGVRETILGAFESLGAYLSGLPSAIMNLIDKYMSGLPVIGALWNSAKGAIGIPSMAVGGDILSDGLVYAHSGETIIPARVNQNTSSRTNTSTAQITNHNTFVIQREDDRVLFQKFQQMLVADQRRLVI